eukprot:scaffold113_cov73-Skeletonema_marinoi.AAC.3
MSSASVFVRVSAHAEEELDMISMQSGWQPYYCIDAMRVVISEGLKWDETNNEWKKNAAQAAMEQTICTLANSIGGCRSTGLPTGGNPLSQILSRPSAHWVHSTPLL